MSRAFDVARLNRTGAPTFASAQAARGMEVYYGSPPSYIRTAGALTAGDGGGGDWRWDAASVADDNTGTVLMLTGWAGDGRYVREWSGQAKAIWFGQDGAAIIAALAVCADVYVDATDAGYSADETIYVDASQRLEFAPGAKVVWAGAAGGTVIATTEGSGYDIGSTVTAKTKIGIVRPYVELTGAGTVGILASKGGHDIEIDNAVVRSLDDAGGNIGIRVLNCFNVQLINPSCILLGANDIPCEFAAYKYEADGVTPHVGYAVMTNNVIRSGTLKCVGEGSTAFQLISADKVGDLTVSGPSGSGIELDNVALLSDVGTTSTTSVKVYGAFNAVLFKTLHTEKHVVFLQALMDARLRLHCSSCLFADHGTLIHAPMSEDQIGTFESCSVYKAGAVQTKVISNASIGKWVFHDAEDDASAYATLNNGTAYLRNTHKETAQKEITGAAYDARIFLDDDRTIIHKFANVNVAVTLPDPCPLGQTFRFLKLYSGGISVTAEGTTNNAFFFGGVTNTATSISSSSAGALIEVVRVSRGWYVSRHSGVWA